MIIVGWKSSWRGLIGPGKHKLPSQQNPISLASYSDLQRATVDLQMKLGHLSSLHEHRNVSALKAAVLEVERLIGRLSEFSGPAAMKTKERIKEDWKLGWDGIVKGPARTRKVQKPKLTLDEEDLFRKVS